VPFLEHRPDGPGDYSGDACRVEPYLGRSDWRRLGDLKAFVGNQWLSPAVSTPGSERSPALLSIGRPETSWALRTRHFGLERLKML